MIETLLIGLGLSGVHAVSSATIEDHFDVTHAHANVAAGVLVLMTAPFLTGTPWERAAKFIIALVFIVLFVAAASVDEEDGL